VRQTATGATVGATRPGRPGKATHGADPRARRPAITGVNAATPGGVPRWVSSATEQAGLQ